MLITARWLLSIGACAPQVKLFEAEWPDGVEPGPDALARARELRLDVAWLASDLLTPPVVLAQLAGDPDPEVRLAVRRTNDLVGDELARLPGTATP